MRDYPVVTDAHAHVKTKAEALERIREGIPTMSVEQIQRMQMGDGALPYAGSRRNSVSGFWSPSMVCGSMEGGGYDAIPGKMPGDR